MVVKRFGETIKIESIGIPMKLLIVVSFTDLIILDPENTFQMKS